MLLLMLTFSILNSYLKAYERGLMIAVVPFTSKVLPFMLIWLKKKLVFYCACRYDQNGAFQILEPCHSSIAYRPPNPWTMGILSLLAEIYNLPNLKMNLKFDIEVLAVLLCILFFKGL
jgi:CCR4-NOT transcription complex subunit 1